jgi:hypothetical protein
MSMKVLEREIEKSRSTNLASSDESSFSLNRELNHTVRPAHELRIILQSVGLRCFAVLQSAVCESFNQQSFNQQSPRVWPAAV